MDIILAVGIILVWLISKIRLENKVDNYDVSKIDNTKLTRDLINGVSVSERRRRYVNGYYDKR